MRAIDADALIVMEYGGIKFVPKEFIDDAPTIEERKTGKWINITNDESLEEEYECSVCGYELFYSNPTKFCSNCGARMEVEQST